MAEQDHSAGGSPQTPFSVLRRFARERPPAERCELCSLELPPEHTHLVEPSTRKLRCSCEACAVLFTGRSDAKFRRVPRRVSHLVNFAMTDSQWDGLHLPINLAFFFYSSPAKKVVALYPSPAGPVESQLALDSWDELVRANPSLSRMEPDVEALLVNRLGASRGVWENEYYLTPIDQCYTLVGLVRMHWRGLSGGTEVWKEIRTFFDRLRSVAKPVREEASCRT